MRKDKYIQPDLSLLGAEHVKRYRETNGEVGHIWNGATALLLTTIGRKSGEARTQPLIYGTHQGKYIVVASKGGAPSHPAWYLNLCETPQVEIQVKEQVMKATARTADDAERETLWQVMTAVWPNYEQYAERTERKIPVVVLEPQGN